MDFAYKYSSASCSCVRWHVLYAAILLTICVLWSPSKNNLQYAYMDELGQEEQEEGLERDDDAGASTDGGRGA